MWGMRRGGCEGHSLLSPFTTFDSLPGAHSTAPTGQDLLPLQTGQHPVIPEGDLSVGKSTAAGLFTKDNLQKFLSCLSFLPNQ